MLRNGKNPKGNLTIPLNIQLQMVKNMTRY